MTIDLNEATKDINKQVKFAVITLGIIVGLVLLFLLGRWIVKLIVSDSSVREAEREIIKSELSYDKSWYLQSADVLYLSMKGLTTNEPNIYRILGQLKTKSDWQQLISSFGTRDEMNLVQWLIDDLNNSEIAQVNNILAPIGVSI